MLKADLQSVPCAPDPDAPCWGAAPFLASPAPGLPILVPPAPATKLNLRKNVDLKLRLQPKKNMAPAPHRCAATCKKNYKINI